MALSRLLEKTLNINWALYRYSLFSTYYVNPKEKTNVIHNS